MEHPIQIFMRRDGMSLEEAKETFSLIRGEITEAIEDAEDALDASEEVEEILEDYELEPDYLDYFLL